MSPSSKGGGASRRKPPRRKPSRPTGATPRNASRPTSAASRNAARQAAARRAARQRQERLLGGVAAAVVVVVVAVFIIVKATGSSAPVKPYTRAPVPAAEYTAYAATPVATLAAAAKSYSSKDLIGYPAVADDPPITTTGKPELLFMGAEFCPYCATERWALVLALSKFGTFHHLSIIRSSSTDYFPNTPTWSFYGATYTSKYLKLVTVETETDTHAILQAPTKQQSDLIQKYNDGSIPFAYFNGKAILGGVEYNPGLLKGLTFAEAAKQIEAGSSPLASAVYADAGAITSEVCRMTGGKPASVCRAFPEPITKVA